MNYVRDQVTPPSNIASDIKVVLNVNVSITFKLINTEGFSVCFWLMVTDDDGKHAAFVCTVTVM